MFLFNWQETNRVIDKGKKSLLFTRREKEREGAREKVQQEQERKRAKDREGERARDIQRNWEQEPERERGGVECADAAFLVWTPQINNQQRFGQAVPGTGAYCQAPARPGPPCYHHYPHPSCLNPPTHSIPSPQPDSGGQIGGAACLPVRARPSLAHCHRAFACSGVLIKSFIVLHSRKELRRNTEQNGAEGRRESGRGEKKREKRKGGVGGREGNGISLFFSLLLSSFLFL